MKCHFCFQAVRPRTKVILGVVRLCLIVGCREGGSRELPNVVPGDHHRKGFWFEGLIELIESIELIELIELIDLIELIESVAIMAQVGLAL